MTTTRINHTGHNHSSTTAARTACRKAMKATPVVELVPVCHVGKGNTTHRLVVTDANVTVGAHCGAGLQRGRRAASPIHRLADAPATDINCGRCN